MNRIRGMRYSALALASVSLAALGGFAAAQIADADGGVRADADLEFRIELDNGDPEFRTGIDLDLITATRERRLSFSGDFGVVVPLDDIEAAEFDDPRYGVDYLRDTGRMQLAIGADLRRRDIDDRTFEDPDAPFDEDALTVIEGGTEEQRAFDFNLALGATDPLGVEISYSYDDRIYTDAADPDLRDRIRQEAGLAFRLEADQTLTFGMSTQWTLDDEDPGLGSQRDERVRAGADVMWQIRPDLEITAELAYARSEVESELAGGVLVIQDRDGLNMRFGLGLDRPNGGYRFDISRILHAPGFVGNVNLTRSFELPRGAEVSVSLGAANLPNGETYGTGAFTYDRDLRRGVVALSFTQDATLNGAFDAVERRILEGSYRLDLPRDARIALSGRLTDSDFVDPAGTDLETARLAVNYSRPLTERWDIGAGASWRLTREDGADDRTDERVFFSLERRFSIRQ